MSEERSGRLAHDSRSPHEESVTDNIYEILFETLGMGLFRCDTRGNALDASRTALELLGLSGSRPPGKPNLFRTGALSHGGTAAAALKAIAEGSPYSRELSRRSSPGDHIYLRVHICPTRDAYGQVTGAYGLIEDISNQKRVEEMALRSQRLQVLGEMATGATHTLSNLFQVMSGHAAMTLAGNGSHLSEEVRQNLDKVMESIDTGSEVVRQLQQLGRARMYEQIAHMEIFDLTEVVSDAVHMSQVWSKAKLDRQKMEIKYDLDLTAGCTFRGQRDQIVCVVLNLLMNAVEAMPDGGRIKIRTFPDFDKVMLMVQDTGIGIPDNHLDRITDAFWTTKNSHTGMGLAVNCRILREHRGSMGVKRPRTRGTIFTVKLPYATAPVQVPKVRPCESGNRALSILLIDDEPAVVRILGKGLGKKGHTIFTAHSGQEGLSIVEENLVDVVVCDLGMEGMNGWEVSREIMTHCVDKDIAKPPFILLTGWGGQISQDELYRHTHVDRVVEKPIKIDKLLEIIQEEVAGN